MPVGGGGGGGGLFSNLTAVILNAFSLNKNR